MERRHLGPVEVSAVSLGTMTFGRQTPPQDAFAQMDRAVDAGVTLFDTAEMYPVNPIRADSVGVTEGIIGDWLAARGSRDRVQIATKVAGPTGMVRGGKGYDGAIIGEAIDSSLRRLKTDVIDLYQLHWPMRGHYHFRNMWRYAPDPTPRAEVLAGMEDVLLGLAEAVRAGKVRAVGVSNETAWGMAQWLAAAERVGGPRMVSIQNEYSLLCRYYDTDLAELGAQEDVTLLAYSPLAAGLLTGKYAGGPPPESRAAVDKANGGPGDLGGRRSARVDAAIAAYAAIAAEEGLSLMHLALAFTQQRPFPCIPILGATTDAQLAAQLAGLDARISDRGLAAIRAAHKAHPLPY